MDTKKRSWVKSITWRLVGIFLLGGIAYMVTGDWKEMSIITILFHVIRVVLYYYHERIWENVSWGRIKHPLANLTLNKKDLSAKDVAAIKEQLRALGYID